MDSELFGKSLDYAKKKRKWVLALGALGFTCYGAQRIYTLPCVVKKRQRLLKLIGALVSLAEMVSDSADAIGILSKDLKEFLVSDSDQIPRSFKQLSKIAKSNEFSESLAMATRALAVGILRGYQHESIKSDSFIDKLLTDAGSRFASVVVGSFARNLVMGFLLYSQDLANVDTKLDQSVPRWIEVACEDKCREVLGDVIQLFVSTAVTVYLDKTMNVNTYDEFFSGLTNPKHEAKVRDMLVSVCNGAVETCIQTSHRVWTANTNLNCGYAEIDFEDSLTGGEKGSMLMMKKLNDKSGWMIKMASILVVPSNMKFVLDLAFVAVTSFLQFLLEKVCECIKRSVDVVHEEVEAIRYVSGKSSAVTTLCLTLCVNILNSPWILVPYY